MPIDTYLLDWRHANRKEGQSNDELKGSMTQYYKEGEDRYNYATNRLKEVRGWTREELDSLQEEITSDVARSVPNELKTLQTRKTELQRQFDAPTGFSTPALDKAHIGEELTAVDGQIKEYGSTNLAPFAKLDASINNFELMFASKDERQTLNQLRKSAEQVLQAANPNHEIRYESNGIYVDGELAEASVLQELEASAYETFVSGAASGGAGLAVASLAKQYRKYRALPRGIGALAATATTAAGVYGGVQGAEYDRKQALSKLGLFIDEDYKRQLQKQDVVLGWPVPQYLLWLVKPLVKHTSNWHGWFQGQEANVKKEVIDVMIRGAGLNPNTVSFDVDQWLNTLKKGDATNIDLINRSMLPFLRNEGKSLANPNIKSLDKLSEHDQTLLYFLNTQPEATRELADALSQYPDISKGWLMNAAKTRGENIKKLLKTENFDKKKFSQLMDGVDDYIKSVHDSMNAIYTRPGGQAYTLDKAALLDELDRLVPAEASRRGRVIPAIKKKVDANPNADMTLSELVDVYRDTIEKYSPRSSEQNRAVFDSFLDAMENQSNKLGDNVDFTNLRILIEQQFEVDAFKNVVLVNLLTVLD